MKTGMWGTSSFHGWLPWACWPLRYILTNSILWWQVYSVSVEILQKGSVHQVWELVHFYTVFITFIQQWTEMLTSGGTKSKIRHDKDFFSPQSRVVLNVPFGGDLLCVSRNVALLHLHADVCTEGGAADSRAPCKGAWDKNADTLCSSVFIKRKGLSMIPHWLKQEQIEDNAVWRGV